MKHLKILGIAAVAGMALMAFGASAATATTLFKNAAKTEVYPSGTTIHLTLKAGTSTDSRSTSKETIATCTESTVEGHTSALSGKPLSGVITILKFEKCSQTTDVLANGSLDIEYTSGNNGTVKGTNNAVTFGIFGVSCTYGTGEGTTLGTLDGGEEPVVTMNAVINKTAGGFLCPTTVVWTGTYVATTPKPLYVGP